MRYYAVAVGRKQMITTKYREYRKLVKGYPDAKYLTTEDLDKAEDFIKKYNSSIVKKDAPFYEETVSFANCFTNSKVSTSKGADNIIWITSHSIVKEPRTFFNPDFQVFTKEVHSIHNALSYTLMTSCELSKLEPDIRSKNLSGKNNYNFYMNSESSSNTFKAEFNIMILNSLTGLLKTLLTAGQDSVYIVTDSHYLSNLLAKDVFANQVTASYSVKVFEHVYKLYSTLRQFDRVYFSRYEPDDKGIYHQQILKNKCNECYTLMEGYSET